MNIQLLTKQKLQLSGKQKFFCILCFILLFIQASKETFASHAQSADITYKCLGGNQYQISLSFYRDCAGVDAPPVVMVNVSSASSGQNFTVSLDQIPKTGIDVSPICTQLATQCTDGTYPGVQEFIYRGIVTLPAQCTDWVFSFNLCCRNASIGSIIYPSSQNIYVEARLDNVNFPGNSSPTFSNAPIPFACVGQPYCFNNGSSDIDGDSLSYTLITPKTSAGSTVVYTAPYSTLQPLASSPLVSFNAATGDMCMTPTQLQVTVFAILVQEWRNRLLVGSVIRDVQLRTINCTNNNPYITGINHNGRYTLTSCADVPINFNINTYDIDSSQNLTITWNSGIKGATFTSSAGSRPTATFSWTPTVADISNTPYCFTVTVKDDNCPYNGSQTYSFCITITGIILNTSSTATNCNTTNGTARVQVFSGTAPYTYQWLPTGGTIANATGLQPGTYTVNVTDAYGCMNAGTTSVIAGSLPSNVTITPTSISCYDGNDGTATANVNGGLSPYTYKWNNGAVTSTINGLITGVYSVVVTTANGCTTTASTTITQPTPLTNSITHSKISCNGLSDGTATVSVTGGTSPYSYVWNTTPIQISATALNLSIGIHSVIVTDNNGCSISTSATIIQPEKLTANAMIVNNISCNGLTNGFITVGASGGTGLYKYMWSTTPTQYIQTITDLAPGTYSVTVTDTKNCTAKSNITITQPAPLKLTTEAFPVTCHGERNGQATAIPTGGTPLYDYEWLPTGGTNSSASGLYSGTYSIKITDANGCVATDTLIIKQPDPIVTTAMGSTTICLGQNTSLSASAIGGNGGYTYKWTTGETGSSQTVNPSSSTTYTVVATDTKGCMGNTASVIINVTSLTAANLTVSGATSICYGNSTNVSSAVTGNTGPVTINWSNGLGAGNGPFSVSPSISTTYTVTVTDVCDNSIYSTIPITVNPLPPIDLPAQSVSGCSEASLTFVNNSITNNDTQYLWNFGDGTTSDLTSPSHNYATSGTYNINVLLTSVYGCTNTLNTTVAVTIHPQTQARFTAEAMNGSTISPIYKFSSSSINAVTQLWYFGDGSKSTEKNPQHSYPDKGEYLVKLVTTSAMGCVDSISIPIEITEEFALYIPNAFTPDGNGNNDNFTAKGQGINEFSMMIFNRWGELIYQTTDITKGWDGKANNGSGIAQTDAYVYKIQVVDFKQRYHDYTGCLNLLTNE